MIKTKKHHHLHEDAWVKIYHDEIEFPDGTAGTYTWADRKDGVGIVVCTKNRKMVLHKEFRYPIHDYSWEVQGGGIDPGESAKEAAIRELREEAGLEVGENDLIDLGSFYPIHSFNTQLVSFFMVIVDEQHLSVEKHESGELISDLRFVPFSEVYEFLDSGKINDANTANAVQLAMRKFEKL